MKSFLHLVAEDLLKKFGKDLSNVAIVFPNKRAGLFMNECLVSLAGDAPLWAPRYMTINELFASLAPDIAVNDPVDTTLRLVSLFQQLSEGESVSVEWFYGWAERILADFDDVDKNMADADALFSNISDLKQFDDTSYLTEEQVAELRRFFGEFDAARKGDLRDKYRQLWDVLGTMYHSLNEQLASNGCAYEGALYRTVVERLGRGETEVNPNVTAYAFVGFNVLDKVERELFRFLQKEGKALFYWDYDLYYTEGENRHEAGLFVRENLLAFPNELPRTYFGNFAQPKKVEMIAASTEAIQAQYVAPWLQKNMTDDARQTAVVLCNENILQPVLHALPENVTDLNVTKGFPLSHTEIVTKVERKLNTWESEKESRPVKVLLEELVEMVTEGGRAFVNREDYDAAKFEDILQGEAYYLMSTILNRLVKVLPGFEHLNLSLVTLRRLLRQIVRSASVPFHGEPAIGLQIMGVLETRCLDFERIIMLSVNDGMLPKKANDNSFIPYLLRKAYGLTTPERKTAVYAFYFYRLLQRASHVTMTYNTSTDGMSTGEMSRFMTQMLVEWGGKVEHYTLNSSQRSVVGTPQAKDKPTDILARITKERDGITMPSLSPSALTSYLRCQLQFYYNQVLHIHEPEEETDEMKANTFGSIFHRAAEMIYLYILKNRKGVVSPEYLKALASDKEALDRYVREAFENVGEKYRLLEARVIELYLQSMLRYDASHESFKVVGTERKVSCIVDVPMQGNTEQVSGDTEQLSGNKVQVSGNKVQVRINGFIDRLDLVQDKIGVTRLRILDYKTGSGDKLTSSNRLVKTEAKAMAEIFEQGTHKEYMLQTLLYGLMLRREAKNDKKVEEWVKHPATPSLFFIRYASNSQYNPYLAIADQEVDDIEKVMPEFEANLQRLLSEILDTTRKFEPTDVARTCETCPYRSICFANQEA